MNQASVHSVNHSVSQSDAPHAGDVNQNLTIHPTEVIYNGYKTDLNYQSNVLDFLGGTSIVDSSAQRKSFAQRIQVPDPTKINYVRIPISYVAQPVPASTNSPTDYSASNDLLVSLYTASSATSDPVTPIAQTVVPAKYVEAVSRSDWPEAQGSLVSAPNYIQGGVFNNVPSLLSDDATCIAAGNYSVLFNANFVKGSTYAGSGAGGSQPAGGSALYLTNFTDVGDPTLQFASSGTLVILLPPNTVTSGGSGVQAITVTYTSLSTGGNPMTFSGLTWSPSSLSGNIPDGSLVYQSNGDNTIYISEYQGTSMSPWRATVTAPTNHVAMVYAPNAEAFIAVDYQGRLWSAPFSANGTIGQWSQQSVSDGVGTLTSATTLTFGPYKQTSVRSTYGTLPQMTVYSKDGTDYLFIIGGAADNNVAISSVYAIPVGSGGTFGSGTLMAHDIPQPAAVVPFYGGSIYVPGQNYTRPRNSAFSFGDRIYYTSYINNIVCIYNAKVAVGQDNTVSIGFWESTFRDNMDGYATLGQIWFDWEWVVGGIVNDLVFIFGPLGGQSYVYSTALSKNGGSLAAYQNFVLYPPSYGLVPTTFCSFDNYDGTFSIVTTLGSINDVSPNTWLNVPVNIATGFGTAVTTFTSNGSSTIYVVIEEASGGSAHLGANVALSQPKLFQIYVNGLTFTYTGATPTTFTGCSLLGSGATTAIPNGATISGSSGGATTINGTGMSGASTTLTVASTATFSTSTIDSLKVLDNNNTWSNYTDNFNNSALIPLVVNGSASNGNLNVPFALLKDGDVLPTLPTAPGTAARSVLMLNYDFPSEQLQTVVQWTEASSDSSNPIDTCSVLILDWYEDYPITAWTLTSQRLSTTNSNTAGVYNVPSTIPVDSIIGFKSSGIIRITTGAKTYAVVTYAGLQQSPPAFTGCTGTMSRKSLGANSTVIQFASTSFNVFLDQIRSV